MTKESVIRWSTVIVLVLYVLLLVLTGICMWVLAAGSKPGSLLITCSILHFISDALVAFFAAKSLWKQYKSEQL